MISLSKQRLDDNVYFRDEIYLPLIVEMSKFSSVKVIFDTHPVFTNGSFR
jgi:hypothetical protein